MSDFKASIKIEFSIFGVTEKTDMYVNYFADSECYGVDQRVIDFFREAYEKAYAGYRNGLDDNQHETEEAAEREEYERLKAKFG
jgi:hypothetical protein